MRALCPWPKASKEHQTKKFEKKLFFAVDLLSSVFFFCFVSIVYSTIFFFFYNVSCRIVVQLSLTDCVGDVLSAVRFGCFFRSASLVQNINSTTHCNCSSHTVLTPRI